MSVMFTLCLGMCLRPDTNSSALNGLVVVNYLSHTHTLTHSDAMISFQWPCSYLPALILAGCSWRRWGSEQVWFVVRRHHRVQTIYTIPSHNASLCQDVIRGEGVGGWTARYRSRNSPETKRLFFAAKEEMCACSLFIQSNNRPRLPLCLCPGS